ncbi:MAG: KTSC domain-containing protein [Bacteroidetes bacterium]|nr:KTSC domain-containing protein [Bacteroidota bacterium]
MEREYVESTMILSFGYDQLNSILEIEFKSNGALWQYLNVPESIFLSMKTSTSYGQFFHSNIKGRFDELRIV